MVDLTKFDPERIVRSLEIVESANGRSVSMPFEKWENIGAQLVAREHELGRQLDITRVMRGLWWRYGVHHYGARAHQADGATLAVLGVSERTLNNDAVMFSKINPEVLEANIGKLSFEQFEAVARAKPHLQEKIAAKAIRDGLTSDDIKRHIAGKNQADWEREKALMLFQQSWSRLDKPGRSIARRWLREQIAIALSKFHRPVMRR